MNIKQFATLCLSLLLSGLLAAQQTSREKISIDMENVSIKEFFEEIQKQTNLNFVYNAADAKKMKPISVHASNKSVKDVLDRVFRNSGFNYRIEGNIITFHYKNPGEPAVAPKQSGKKERIAQGMVTDKRKDPLPGVGVWLKGTKKGIMTDAEGRFRLDISDQQESVIQFSYLGMTPQEVTYSGQAVINITMEENPTELGEAQVVATGMFTRNAETFTGAATTFNAEDLKKVGNQNILFSLKNLDPSFVITENLTYGSDPNKLPDMQLRGQNSIADIKGEYQTSLNQPLFILNGFETTVEKVYDLDMNLVKTVTLLKDAAAKAIYGSKAANGVVVIETILPQTGNLRLSYIGNANITGPDLSSYHLTNSSEKLQAEVLAGKYTSSNAYSQAQLTEQYNELYKEVERGVDTYWMSRPLRTGLGQKHTILLDGGDQSMRYSASLGYNNVAGVMKGSDRTTISGNITLLYRYKNFSFSNNLTIDNNNSKNSPYGSFSDYSKMNPYWRIYNEDGSLRKQYNNTTYNPLYNAHLNSKNQSRYTTITENFYGEWRVMDHLKITFRLGVNKQDNGSDVFIPATNTMYASISPTSEEYLLRGQYTKGYGSSLATSADAGVSYSINKGKHLLYTNVLYNIEQNQTEGTSVTAVGFPSDKMNSIDLGSQYLTGSSPSGTESTTRSVGVVGSANYSYDNKYLSDVSYRLNGSSQFGANRRWGSFWSVGLGWNIHHESFMKALPFIDLLKVKGSLGYTGSQNFSSYQSIATYGYIADKTYNGDMGVTLRGLANDNLKWQQQYDRNLGIDISLIHKLSFKVNIYKGTTTNLLTDVALAPSSGFSTYKENLGETQNKGFELGVNWRAWANPSKRSSLSIFANIAHNSNKISKISDALKQFNKEQDADKEKTGGSNSQKEAQRTPSIRYEEGQSMNAIWAVRSNGIDPITGKEVFIKKDGSTTYTWSTTDQMVVGDSNPKYRGNIGFNFSQNGFETNISFSYKFGGQAYNQTLVDKVENADVLNWNVDKRVVTERWNTPGIAAKFKGIQDQSITKPTSRFVENLNEFVFSSVNIAYDFSKLKLMKKSALEYCKLGFNMNDVAWISSMKREQGLEYPMARTFSFSLQIRL